MVSEFSQLHLCFSPRISPFRFIQTCTGLVTYLSFIAGCASNTVRLQTVTANDYLLPGAFISIGRPWSVWGI